MCYHGARQSTHERRSTFHAPHAVAALWRSQLSGGATTAGRWERDYLKLAIPEVAGSLKKNDGGCRADRHPPSYHLSSPARSKSAYACFVLQMSTVKLVLLVSSNGTGKVTSVPNVPPLK